MTRELPGALGSAGVPARVGQALSSTGGLQALTGVGSGGQTLLASLPAGARDLVAPYVPSIVDAVHSAFSIATASTFVVGIGTALVASGLVVLFREAPAEARQGAWEADRADNQEVAQAAA